MMAKFRQREMEIAQLQKQGVTPVLTPGPGGKGFRSPRGSEAGPPVGRPSGPGDYFLFC